MVSATLGLFPPENAPPGGMAAAAVATVAAEEFSAGAQN